MKRIFQIAIAAVTGGLLLTASPAQACRGPQFEYTINMFQTEAVKKLPKGTMQLKVTASAGQRKYAQKQNILRLSVVGGEFADTTIIVPMPMLTSCDNMAGIPQGEFYVTGAFAKGIGGRRIYMRSGWLFDAMVEQRKSNPLPAPPAAENAS